MTVGLPDDLFSGLEDEVPARLAEHLHTMPIEGVRKNLEDNGWTIVGEDTVPFTAVSDWRPILSKIRKANPDLVANFDWNPSNEALFLQQFLEDPTDSYVYLYYAPSVPEFLELTGDDADGVIWSLVGGPVRQTERAQHISEVYADEYDDQAGSVGMKLYEEIHAYAYANALESVGDPTDHTAIGEALGVLQVPETANGPLEFDPETHLAKSGEDHFPIKYYQYQNGEVVTISPDWAADASFKTPHGATEPAHPPSQEGQP